MSKWIFYLLVIVFFANVSGCGVKSSPFLNKKTNLIKDE